MLGHGRARAPRARLAEHLATMAGGIALAWARETVRRAQDVKRARAACESARAHGRPEGTAIERLGRALRRLDEASEAADAWAREYGATAAALSGELLAARRRRGTAP